MGTPIDDYSQYVEKMNMFQTTNQIYHSCWYSNNFYHPPHQHFDGWDSNHRKWMVYDCYTNIISIDKAILMMVTTWMLWGLEPTKKTCDSRCDQHVGLSGSRSRLVVPEGTLILT